MLLVMSNGGYLAPPSEDEDQSPEQEELWEETWKRVNRFLPNFLGELFPEEVGKPVKTRSKEVPIREKEVEKDGGKREGEQSEEEEEEVEGKEKVVAKDD
jgi:brefeldin A-resistance guanine nucleotide exchange factor 1